jgi:hypothetical protein
MELVWKKIYSVCDIICIFTKLGTTSYTKIDRLFHKTLFNTYMIEF